MIEGDWEARLHSLMGNLLLLTENYEQAIRSYDPAIRLAPNTAYLYFNRGVHDYLLTKGPRRARIWSAVRNWATKYLSTDYPFSTVIVKVPTQTENLEVDLNLPSKEGLNIAAVISTLYSVTPNEAP